MHAKAEDIAKVKGRYDAGWDVLRIKRLAKLKELSILNAQLHLSARDEKLPAWDEIPEVDKAWYSRRMEVYAAQIEAMDQGIGKLIQTLEQQNLREDTLIIFMSDNGACHEELHNAILKRRTAIGVARSHTKSGQPVNLGNNKRVLPGAENTFQSVGKSWANLSNSPFRGHKNMTLEGGIVSPLIMSYPNGIHAKGEIRHGVAHLVDLMPTLLHFAHASYPQNYPNRIIPPLPGIDLNQLIISPESWLHPECYWEYEDNAAIRYGDLKLVKQPNLNWELYQMDQDRTERIPMQKTKIKEVWQLQQNYDAWAQMIGVVPYNKIWMLKIKNVIRQNVNKLKFWQKPES